MMKDELNNGGGDFEKRLQRVAPRDVPPAWRKEILAAARAAEASPHASRITHHGFLSTLIAQLSTSLRPQRAAWAGLAAVWLVILAMNLSAPDRTATAALAQSRPSTETLQVLQQQKQLLAELVERAAPPAADRHRIVPPGPRSQRPNEVTAV
jgi:hypothetical protein